jgi:hypothetical protein
MNYREMLDKFKALEDAIWELAERIAKLEKQLMEQGN